MPLHTRLALPVLLGVLLLSAPAAAQTSSLTHAVSVVVGPRVKVKVSALSLTAPRSIPAPVGVTTANPAGHGFSVTVQANRAWVLASAEGILASGSASSAVDSAVVFPNPTTSASSRRDPIVLTMSAP